MCFGWNYRILTVSNGWVTVTAPHAAMPPAMKALYRTAQYVPRLLQERRLRAYPVVVDMFFPGLALPRWVAAAMGSYPGRRVRARMSGGCRESSPHARVEEGYLTGDVRGRVDADQSPAVTGRTKRHVAIARQPSVLVLTCKPNFQKP